MISYIKEYTVEVIKQPAPMYHTHILNDTFVKKPLASLGSSNQKKKKPSLSTKCPPSRGAKIHSLSERS